MGKICLISLLLVFYAFFLWHPVNFVTADLGRHIKNGELILAGEFDVLNKNFYSYTEPDHPAINHHWLSGVVFYTVWKLAGFKGLHLFYIVLSLATFLIFFNVARRDPAGDFQLLISRNFLSDFVERAPSGTLSEIPVASAVT